MINNPSFKEIVSPIMPRFAGGTNVVAVFRWESYSRLSSSRVSTPQSGPPHHEVFPSVSKSFRHTVSLDCGAYPDHPH